MLEELTPQSKEEKRRYAMRHYVVTGNVVKTSGAGKTGRMHTRFGCVAKSVKRALELAEKANPGFEATSVSDQGAIDFVDTE